MSRRHEPAEEPVTPPGSDWRLLSGWAARGRAESYSEHVERFGRLPLRTYAGAAGRQQLVDVIAQAGLLGRGGAAFPTARKLVTVASGRGRAVVVGNGCEGEPSSRKDRILAEYAPHLVVDGALLAAHVTGADQAYLCMHDGSPGVDAVTRAARGAPQQGERARRGRPRRFRRERGVRARALPRHGRRAADQQAAAGRSSVVYAGGRRSSATSRPSRSWR